MHKKKKDSITCVHQDYFQLPLSIKIGTDQMHFILVYYIVFTVRINHTVQKIFTKIDERGNRKLYWEKNIYFYNTFCLCLYQPSCTSLLNNDWLSNLIKEVLYSAYFHLYYKYRIKYIESIKKCKYLLLLACIQWLSKLFI